MTARRRAPAACAALLALGAAACRGDGGVADKDLEGLVVSPAPAQRAVDPRRAAREAGELGRALAMPHTHVTEVLGPHEVALTARYEVKQGAELAEKLADETSIVVTADGWHARYDNSADYGREVFFKDGALLLRPRYAQWHRRAPTDEREPDTIRNQMYAVAGDYFDLVAFAAVAEDQGATEQAGRPARKVALTLASAPGKPPAQPLAQRKWREGVQVTALTGEAVLDAATALPLAAKFAATLTYTRDGKPFEMSLAVTHAISAIGSPRALELPAADQVVATPGRSREVDERDQLLDGIAPKARRGARPAEPTP